MDPTRTGHGQSPRTLSGPCRVRVVEFSFYKSIAAGARAQTANAGSVIRAEGLRLRLTGLNYCTCVTPLLLPIDGRQTDRRTDGRTDGRTLDRYIDPSLHTMRAKKVKVAHTPLPSLGFQS